MQLHPRAGQTATPDMLVDLPKLITAYYTGKPDPGAVEQRVSFGTSGHRGSAFANSFNEDHILAVTQAICLYRAEHGINGPLFMGIDTHALSTPACATAMEVLAANGVEVMLAQDDEYTPTPAISHAILCYNKGRASGLADGIVVTPSHNPPKDGGFKYNPTNGGPADTAVTRWIQDKANALLAAKLEGVKRMPLAQALRASTTHRHDFLGTYVNDLGSVLDMEAIRAAGVRLGVDPLGGAGVHYWGRIAEQYKLNLTVVNQTVDPTFRFMTLDWDGQIRMDPSSRYAMQGLIAQRERFDICFACDTDHDRHGVVTRADGLLPTNHYLSAAIYYLFQNRPRWPAAAAVGKTVVSSQIMDRIAARLKRKLYEVPVGFKYFAGGLEDGSLGFGCEESAGAAFVRMDGSPWSTDKDGITACLLSAEIAARSGSDPGALYKKLAEEFGNPVFERVDAPATRAQKAALEKLSPEQVKAPTLAGDKITSIITRAPGNDAAIGGLRVMSENGWFAARPSGTEDIYKVYAESFRGKEHLARIMEEAQAIVTAAVA